MERVFLIRDFVRESNRIEGIGREPTEQEVNAHRDFLKLQFIRVEDLENLVSVLQPGAKLREEAGMDVRVGDYVAPRGGPEIVEPAVQLAPLHAEPGRLRYPSRL